MHFSQIIYINVARIYYMLLITRCFGTCKKKNIILIPFHLFMCYINMSALIFNKFYAWERKDEYTL